MLQSGNLKLSSISSKDDGQKGRTDNSSSGSFLQNSQFSEGQKWVSLDKPRLRHLCLDSFTQSCANTENSRRESTRCSPALQFVSLTCWEGPKLFWGFFLAVCLGAKADTTCFCLGSTFILSFWLPSVHYYGCGAAGGSPKGAPG